MYIVFRMKTLTICYRVVGPVAKKQRAIPKEKQSVVQKEGKYCT
jgi:hypothetical protein